LYKWYEQQPKQTLEEHIKVLNEELKDIETKLVEVKKRGRKPKANG